MVIRLLEKFNNSYYFLSFCRFLFQPYLYPSSLSPPTPACRKAPSYRWWALLSARTLFSAILTRNRKKLPPQPQCGGSAARCTWWWVFAPWAFASFAVLEPFRRRHVRCIMHAELYNPTGSTILVLNLAPRVSSYVSGLERWHKLVCFKILPNDFSTFVPIRLWLIYF